MVLYIGKLLQVSVFMSVANEKYVFRDIEYGLYWSPLDVSSEQCLNVYLLHAICDVLQFTQAQF